METVTRDNEQNGASTTVETDTVRQERRSQPDVATDPDRLLGVLGDDGCRQLLAATAIDSLTATELASACEIPSSTVYRKIEQLLEQGLLEESIRVVTDGYHTKEYSMAVEEIRISIVDREGIEFDVSTVE